MRRLPGPAGRILGQSVAATAAVPALPGVVNTTVALDGSRLAASTGGSSSSGADEPYLPPPPVLAGPEAQSAYFGKCPAWLACAAALDLQPPVPPRGTAGASSVVVVDGWPAGVAKPPLPLRNLLRMPKRSVPRVPLIVALVTAVRPSESDVLLSLRDPTASLTACATRRVLDEAGKALCPGAVLVLRRSSVFSPTPASRYVNVVPANVAAVFGPWERPPAQRQPVRVTQQPASASQ